MSDYRKNLKKENGVTTSMILITVFLFLFVLMLVLPNIYLDNNIYYESRKIAHYNHIYQTLLAEQKIIRHKLEEVKFQENISSQEN
jgi:competence protein ComGC